MSSDVGYDKYKVVFDNPRLGLFLVNIPGGGLKVGGKGNGENSHSIKKDDVVLMINEVTLNKWGIDCFEDFVQFLGKHKARPLSMTFGRKRGVQSSPSVEVVEEAAGGEEEFSPVAPVSRARPGMVTLNSTRILKAKMGREGQQDPSGGD
mmetsp:Transcript_79619/g.227326  ORF Transcript_79619/g.227326 Transcript_79619/m.227326 type:complete len:150 (-) Transcript_79619:213-662(-)